MDATTVLSGRKAFTGNSNGFIESVIDFSSLGMAPAFVRFRMTTDDGTAGEGWFVDDIIRSNGCGGTFRTGIYSNTGTRMDTVATPVFVKSAPSTITINTQPVSAGICAGENITFTIAASSATALNYQWQANTGAAGAFVDLVNETNATLNLTAVTSALHGVQYRCVLTDATTTLNSAVVTLTVNASPVVITQPVDKTVCVGANVNFAIAASGTSNFTWQVSTDGGTNFSAIPGSTSSSYSVTTTAAMNGNKYRCIMTNSCGSKVSDIVTLTVENAAITSSPVNTAACAGATAVLNVVTIGNGLSYQWQTSTNGSAGFTNIIGANTASLTIPNLTGTHHNNQYRCIVTAACGVMTSSVATLTVTSIDINIAALPARICESDAEIILNATPAGGTWSGKGVANGRFSPSIADTGHHIITYTVNNGGCITTKDLQITVEDCVDRIITFGNNGILLYPNPNNGEFFIKLNSLLYSQFTMDVYNSTGQHLKRQEFKNLQYGSISTVNLKPLTSGVYHVKLYTKTSNGNMDEKTFTILIR